MISTAIYPARRFSSERVLKSVESVLKTRDINRLSQEAYEFITSYCGTAPHYSISGWKHAHRDVRDFANLFVKSNEYGINLERAVKENSGKDLPEEFGTVSGIVELCRTYKEEVFRTLDLSERRESVKIANHLLRGTISLKDFFGARTFPTRSLSHYNAGMKSAKNIRELVEEVNRLIDVMDIDGIKELVRKYPKEAIVAGNYVNAKVRYVVQSIIASEVGQLKREKKEQS
jgi:hypothetical protein